MKSVIDWVIIIVFIVLSGAVINKWLSDESKTPTATPTPRYDCEDNSDTTKGHYKDVLTHCVPVKITRTM